MKSVANIPSSTLFYPAAKKFWLLLIIVTCLFASAEAKPRTNKFLDTTYNRLLIINAFDAMAMKARKNKKELFKELADSIVADLYDNLRYRQVEVLVIPEIVRDTANLDSTVRAMLVQHYAYRAIVIKSLDAFFVLTDVEVEKFTNKSKSRTAYFDICANIKYRLYGLDTMEESEPKTSHPFTSRGTMGGLVSFGPDIVGKRKHAIKIIQETTRKMLTEF